MALAAGTYRGRLGGQIYQAEPYEAQDAGLNGVVYESLRGLGSTSVKLHGRERVRFSPSEFWSLVAAAQVPRESLNNKVESEGGYLYVSKYVADYLYGQRAAHVRQMYIQRAKQMHMRGIYEDAGMTTGDNAPMRVTMFGRTKVMYSLRQQATMQEHQDIRYSRAQAHESFQTREHSTSRALGAIGLGGIAGALLAAALL